MEESLSSVLFDFFLEGSSEVGENTLDLEDTPAFTSLTVNCAWCMSEAGTPLGGGSHGICAAHAHSVRETRQATRGRRRA